MWVADEGKREVRCCSGCYSIGVSESSPALIVLYVVYKIEGTTHLVREQKWVVHKLGSTTPWTSRALSLLLFLLKPRSTSHSLLLYPILYEYDSITITPQHLHINIQSSSISIPSLFYFKKVVVYWIRCCVGASAYFTYCLRSFHSVSCDVTTRGRQLLPPITNWHNLDYRISNVNKHDTKTPAGKHLCLWLCNTLPLLHYHLHSMRCAFISSNFNFNLDEQFNFFFMN